MALVLRSRTDLVYLPDHGFVGEEGALRILSQITNKTRRIDISHNLLGSDGTITLFKGLSTLRARWNSHFFGSGYTPPPSSSSSWSSPSALGDESYNSYTSSGEEVWGLKEVNLGCNSIGDEALEAVLAYAKKDLFLRKIYAQANEIELRHNLPSIIHTLNQTHLSDLSLTTNPNLDPTSISTLFKSLQTPHLNHLHLSNCSLGPALAKDIISFLKSKRSRNIEYLELNGNGLGYRGVKDIVDVVETENFTILQLGLFANHQIPSPASPEGDGDGEDNQTRQGARIVPGPTGENGDPTEHDERILDQDRKILELESQQLGFQTQKRLPILLMRNRLLMNRVRKAAARMIAPARIILNATPPSDHQIAKSVIENISNGPSDLNQLQASALASNSTSTSASMSIRSSSSHPSSSSSSSTLIKPQSTPHFKFRILDLPREVIYQIVRHTSQDAYALSDAQFARLIREAEDRRSIARVARSMKVRLSRVGFEESGFGPGSQADSVRTAITDVLDGWLRKGGWERWELDREVPLGVS